MSQFRRVISDVIHPLGGSSGIAKDRGMILLCEPDQALRLSSKIVRSTDGLPLQRGDIFSESAPVPTARTPRSDDREISNRDLKVPLKIRFKTERQNDRPQALQRKDSKALRSDESRPKRPLGSPKRPVKR